MSKTVFMNPTGVVVGLNMSLAEQVNRVVTDSGQKIARMAIS
ncbi:MAG: hypothetical protein NTW55_05205 [Planctomycetota bacterium]|nr:hypothetical protein [Planctomycetota bacterium]